jgi:hypothetical protein
MRVDYRNKYSAIQSTYGKRSRRDLDQIGRANGASITCIDFQQPTTEFGELEKKSFSITMETLVKFGKIKLPTSFFKDSKTSESASNSAG